MGRGPIFPFLGQTQPILNRYQWKKRQCKYTGSRTFAHANLGIISSHMTPRLRSGNKRVPQLKDYNIKYDGHFFPRVDCDIG